LARRAFMGLVFLPPALQLLKAVFIFRSYTGGFFAKPVNMTVFARIVLVSMLLLFSRAYAQRPNLVIVTIDGLRWQEVFAGADSAILHNPLYTPDTTLQKALYWDSNAEARRRKLLPFFWSVLANRAQIYGNRLYDNHVNTGNPWNLSYAGYNEMFTGTTDIRVSTNARKLNRHSNIFERLNGMDDYRGRVALFSSWDVFPYILKKEQNDYFFNSAYDSIADPALEDVDAVQRQGVFSKTSTRHDWLTWIAAREYLEAHRPGVVYIAFGETDEWAHKKRYDQYLHHANAFDRMLAELWNWIQTTEGYKNNTSLVITTDHGRGHRAGTWHKHGIFVSGSSQTWMAVASPASAVIAGEQRVPGQMYQYQLPDIIMQLVQPAPQQALHQVKEKPLNHGADKSK
jgi:Type I phosphodiesterase / nucleotide pyrophosphatase